MDISSLLVFGIATFFNFIILKWKFDRARYYDLFLDITTLAILSIIFGGTMGGMAIAMVASFFISIYLLLTMRKTNANP